jgi:hypothetical protein
VSRSRYRAGLFEAAAFLACVSTTFDAAADDVMRCGNGRLVNVGMSAAEIVGRCGEPKSRSVEVVPVRAFSPNGVSLATGDVVRIERWMYDRGQGQFPATLTFEDGELKRIDLLAGR